MKKLSLIMCAIAMMCVSFTSCKKEGGNTPIDNIVENGFYVIGDATGYANLQASGAAKMLMANGVNEVTKSEREGMYEKYVMLEANKDFKLVKKEGDKMIYYKATLAETEIATDGVAIPNGYKGLISEGEAAMQVKAKALYHIVLDLNADGQLDAVKGAQVILAPVEFGVRGAMNGWSYTEAKGAVNGEAITWTWENQEMGADNAEFKFAHGNCWKIVLDDAEQVKAENSLGKDMKAGGDNIAVASRGLYKMTLTFKPASGAIANSFAYTAERTGDIQVKDYSNVELELVGDAVADQTGAEPDASSWGWGNVYPLGKPAKSGDIYTWTASKVKLKVGAYKVRTKGYQDQGDIKAFDNGANINVAADIETDITVKIDAATGAITVEDGSAPLDPVIVTVKAKLPADWTNVPTAWVWPTGGDGVAATLTHEGDWWVYTTPQAVPALNIIFRNGDGWDNGQTVNIENIRENMCYQIKETEVDGKREVESIDCE